MIPLILQLLDKKDHLTSMDLQTAIDEIINDSSVEKPQEIQISPKKLANVLSSVAQETTVPTLPPEIIAAVFEDELLFEVEEQDASRPSWMLII